MEEKIPTHEEALKLLHEYNKSDNLRKHAYTVEGVMRYIARKCGEDEDKWGIIGLIHDLDYEKFPDQMIHSLKIHFSAVNTQRLPGREPGVY